MLRGITCPVLVIQGTEDRCQPRGRFDTVARLTAAERLVLEGSGHLPMAPGPGRGEQGDQGFRRPGHRSAAAAAGLVARPAPSARGCSTCSSPIGLGHVRRDLAIAGALREHRPDVEVEWLTQSPVAEFLDGAARSLHPASQFLASESTHFESESGEHDLHAFQAVRRMDEVLVNNFMVFDDLVDRESFDLWVGDEAWDLDHFLHENPELKRAPFVWMTDFVGWMPMPDGGEREAFLTADYNAEMVEHVARYPRLRDRSVFVGDPADVVDLPLGPGPADRACLDRAALRLRRLRDGRAPDPADRPSSAPTGSGTATTTSSAWSASAARASAYHLLRRVAAAYPEARRRMPGLRMVRGLRAADRPGLAGRAAGVEVHGFLPDLDLHHAACDVAVVQGGLSTTMELTAQRPAVPLLPAGPPLRAAGARAAPAGAAPGRARHGLPRRRPGADRRRPRRGLRRPPSLPPGADRRRRRARLSWSRELI